MSVTVNSKHNQTINIPQLSDQEVASPNREFKIYTGKIFLF